MDKNNEGFVLNIQCNLQCVFYPNGGKYYGVHANL